MKTKGTVLLQCLTNVWHYRVFFFLVLDAKSSFWQIRLDHASSVRAIFSTPFGRYHFFWIAFSINSSSEVFQQAMERIFAGYPCAIFDDIIVGGKVAKEHGEYFKKCPKQSRSNWNRTHTNAHSGSKNSVMWIMEHGINPDPAKLQAITEMPLPDDKATLQRFLATANYLAKFIPNFSDLSDNTTQRRSLVLDTATAESIWHAETMRHTTTGI